MGSCISKGQSNHIKNPSRAGKGNASLGPRFVFGHDNPRDDTELDFRMARPKQRGRHENEDPNANALFQSVSGYKENLRPDGQAAYQYPHDQLTTRSRPAPRVHGEDPAADDLLAGASSRQSTSRPQQSWPLDSMVDVENAIVEAANTRRRLGGNRTHRKVGEDVAADALFANRGNRK